MPRTKSRRLVIAPESLPKPVTSKGVPTSPLWSSTPMTAVSRDLGIRRNPNRILNRRPLMDYVPGRKTGITGTKFIAADPPQMRSRRRALDK